MTRIRQTPRYLNRRAQLLAELDLKRGSSTAVASKLKKRGSTKAKRGTGPALLPEDELLLQQQLDAEVRFLLSASTAPPPPPNPQTAHLACPRSRGLSALLLLLSRWASSGGCLQG